MSDRPQSDALNEALNTIRVRSTVYCPIEIAAPWGLQIPEEAGSPFFILTKGRAWLEIESLRIRRWLHTGDFLLLTKSCVTRISDSPQSKLMDLPEWLRRNPPQADGTFKVKGRGEVSKFIGGTFLIENHESHPLLKVLPPFLHFSATRTEQKGNGRLDHWLDTTIGFLLSEVKSRRPGATPIIARLSDILFIQAVRAFAVTNSCGQQNWFAAAADAQIGEALARIHRAPQGAWTVEKLAAVAGMSRSAFAARFSALVGEPPLRYLSRWRMHLAIEMLREGRLSTAEISSQMGYESEAAFSKAFKKWNGRGPGAYRSSRSARDIGAR